MMDYEIGSRVMRKYNDEWGFIHGIRQARTTMVEVRWEASGTKQWLPAQEVRPLDKTDAPPPVRPTSWGNTTPKYLTALRKQLRQNPNRFEARDKARADKKLADKLVCLSDKRKNRSKMKAQKWVRKHSEQAARAKAQSSQMDKQFKARIQREP
jgi:hypothetical protein